MYHMLCKPEGQSSSSGTPVEAGSAYNLSVGEGQAGRGREIPEACMSFRLMRSKIKVHNLKNDPQS